MIVRIIKITIALTVVLLGVWIARNLEFEETRVPMPLEGEARRNPFYAAVLFSEQLGAEAAWERVFTIPRSDAVLMLSTWNWTLSRTRRQNIEQWVEAGGRLVVDESLIGGAEEFAQWSGISELNRSRREEPEEDTANQEDEPEDTDDTAPEEEVPEFAAEILGRHCDALIEDGTLRSFEVCGIDRSRSLVSSRKILWALREGSQIHALRTAVGRGSVTVINAAPFRHRDLFLGDHATLLVKLAQLHRGDEILFLTEENQPSLKTLIWRFGAPVVVLGLAAIALGLWRAFARFGPRTAPTDAARRSLAEQIRGTGRFALRFGAGEALHAATVRALRDAAISKAPAYDRLSSEERIATLAKLSGVDAAELGPALHFLGKRTPHELRHAIAVLETARRLLLTRRSNHGK